jgi:hypothetical protein
MNVALQAQPNGANAHLVISKLADLSLETLGLSDVMWRGAAVRTAVFETSILLGAQRLVALNFSDQDDAPPGARAALRSFLSNDKKDADRRHARGRNPRRGFGREPT